MKPAPFVLEQPDTLAAALDLRSDDSAYAVPLAGGQSLMPLLNLRLSAPELVVDLNRVEELDHLRFDGSHLVVGSMRRQAAVEDDPEVRKRLPALTEMIGLIGHRTIRNRGTIGGSICHADPSAELPALAMALSAEMVATSVTGSRFIPAADFNHGYLSTDLDATELLTEIRWPLPSQRSVFGSAQFVRRSGDFALAAVAVVIDVGRGGDVEDVRVVAYGSLSRPTRLEPVEQAIRDDPGRASISELGELCGALVRPGADMHGSAAYKRRLFEVMGRRALDQALASYEGGSR